MRRRGRGRAVPQAAPAAHGRAPRARSPLHFLGDEAQALSLSSPSPGESCYPLSPGRGGYEDDAFGGAGGGESPWGVARNQLAVYLEIVGPFAPADVDALTASARRLALGRDGFVADALPRRAYPGCEPYLRTLVAPGDAPGGAAAAAGAAAGATAQRLAVPPSLFAGASREKAIAVRAPRARARALGPLGPLALSGERGRAPLGEDALSSAFPPRASPTSLPLLSQKVCDAYAGAVAEGGARGAAGARVAPGLAAKYACAATEGSPASGVPRAALELATECLRADPARRPSAAAALAHPFLGGAAARADGGAGSAFDADTPAMQARARGEAEAARRLGGCVDAKAFDRDFVVRLEAGNDDRVRKWRSKESGVLEDAMREALLGLCEPAAPSHGAAGGLLEC